MLVYLINRVESRVRRGGLMEAFQLWTKRHLFWIENKQSMRDYHQSTGLETDAGRG